MTRGTGAGFGAVIVVTTGSLREYVRGMSAVQS